ncbi:MAG: 1,4-dihydroxy-2-naphthoate octaprenyltransferase [Halobacteriovoraceae bacterium]|nr:1,4-dihydroxy-2-naphthoate octaprenyltransferase [Halobacteriovoraceae bacterium]|tara:strand:- start:4821 stop:5681 length:861 start_codon:yes stop_codon:yes gene_type:complete
MNILMQGMRPKTLVAAIIPPLTASGLYFSQSIHYDYTILSLCLLLALCIQIATNFYNDAIDYKKGADKDRVGPKRVSNELNVKKIFRWGHLFIMAAFFVGVPLMLKGGWPIALLGLVSMFLAYGYTGGPFPLAYLGLGELFVFLFFGLVATMGSFYLMAESLNHQVFLLACANGLLSCALIAINNLRDKEKDKVVDKNTLAVKMTPGVYHKLLDLFTFGPYFIILYFFVFINLKFVVVLLAVKFAHQTRFIIHHHEKPSELNRALESAGKHLFAFGLLFWLVCLWI